MVPSYSYSNKNKNNGLCKYGTNARSKTMTRRHLIIPFEVARESRKTAATLNVSTKEKHQTRMGRRRGYRRKTNYFEISYSLENCVPATRLRL